MDTSDPLTSTAGRMTTGLRPAGTNLLSANRQPRVGRRSKTSARSALLTAAQRLRTTPPATARRLARTTLGARTTLIVGGALLAGSTALLAGCGVPPELAEAPPAVAAPTPSPTRSSQSTVPPGTRSPTAAPGATATPDERVARDCHGEPSGNQVISLLRRSDLLPDDTEVSVEKPPICAGTWQYTVLRISGHEPLQVVSRGEPGSLTLVTAGTDVCSIPVRVSAPSGIRTLACGG